MNRRNDTRIPIAWLFSVCFLIFRRESAGNGSFNRLSMCEQQQAAALTSASLVWDTISPVKISHGVLGGGAYFRIYQVYLRRAPGTYAVGTPDVKREPEWPLHEVTCFVVTPFLRIVFAKHVPLPCCYFVPLKFYERIFLFYFPFCYFLFPSFPFWNSRTRSRRVVSLDICSSRKLPGALSVISFAVDR